MEQGTLPKISIVTPSFNQASFLESTILSVLSQGYPFLEYIVMDGNSTDGSVEIIRRYEERLAHWQSERDEGQSDALRKGFAMASGEIFAWLNSDDMFAPGALHSVGRYFEENPGVDLLYGNVDFIDPAGRRLFTAYPVLDLRILLYENRFVPQQAMFWKRELYNRVGGVDSTLRFAMDFDLTMRFLKHGAVVGRIHRVLGSFRVHPKAKSATIRDVMRQEVDAVIFRLFTIREGRIVRYLKKIGYRCMRYWKEPRGLVTAVIGKGGPR